jgi:hypothetical protein
MGVNCWASTPSNGGQPIEGKGGLPLGTVCAGTEYTQTYTCTQAYDYIFKSLPAADGGCTHYKNFCCTAPTPAPTPSESSYGSSGGSYGSSGSNGHANPAATCQKCHIGDKPMGVNCFTSLADLMNGGQPIEGKAGLPLGTVCAVTEYTQTYTCTQAYDYTYKSMPAAGGGCAHYKNLCCNIVDSTRYPTPAPTLPTPATPLPTPVVNFNIGSS